LIGFICQAQALCQSLARRPKSFRGQMASVEPETPRAREFEVPKGAENRDAKGVEGWGLGRGYTTP